MKLDKKSEGEHDTAGMPISSVFLGYRYVLTHRADASFFHEAFENLSKDLQALGAREAYLHLGRLSPRNYSLESFSQAWAVLFVRGLVPPYETSHMPPSVTGHLSELADIAGFYNAFGLQAQGERPDHLLPELEFVTFVLIKYQEALRNDNAQAAEICADAFASFLQDHFATWLEAYATKLSQRLPDNPYEPIIASLAAFVSWLCMRTSISPRSLTVPGPAPDLLEFLQDEEELPGCLGCQLPGDREVDIPC